MRFPWRLWSEWRVPLRNNNHLNHITMTKTSITLGVCASFILLSSFVIKADDRFIGTYGVSASDPSQIELTIHADHTFYYQDFSDPNNKIVAEGTWTMKGNKVVLHDNNTDLKYHNVWAFDESGKVAKSRKGLAFYSLIKDAQTKGCL